MGTRKEGILDKSKENLFLYSRIEKLLVGIIRLCKFLFEMWRFEMTVNTRSKKRKKTILFISTYLELYALLADFCYLKRKHLQTAENLASSIATLLYKKVDVIVLDQANTSWLNEKAVALLRERSNLPILMLSNGQCPRAERLVDAVLELPASLHRIYLFIRGYLDTANNIANRIVFVTFQSLRFNVLKRVALCGEKSVSLTRIQATILERLMQAQGAVVSKDNLHMKYTGTPLQSGERGVDVHVSAIRKKIKQISNNTIDILGVRGVGYYLWQKKERKA